MYKIVGDDKKEYGPVTVEQVREWITQGRANGQTLIQAEGSADWRPLASFPEFYAALNPVMPPLSSLPPSSGGPARPAGATLPPLTPPAGPPQTNGMAIAALVMGVLSLVFGWLCCAWMLFTPLGIIFGCIALGQINKRPTEQTGKGLAIAGIILSIVAMIGNVLLWFAVGAMGAMGEAFEKGFKQ